MELDKSGGTRHNFGGCQLSIQRTGQGLWGYPYFLCMTLTKWEIGQSWWYKPCLLWIASKYLRNWPELDRPDIYSINDKFSDWTGLVRTWIAIKGLRDFQRYWSLTYFPLDQSMGNMAGFYYGCKVSTWWIGPGIVRPSIFLMDSK